jgi:hypothetical protein
MEEMVAFLRVGPRSLERLECLKPVYREEKPRIAVGYLIDEGI